MFGSVRFISSTKGHESIAKSKGFAINLEEWQKHPSALHVKEQAFKRDDVEGLRIHTGLKKQPNAESLSLIAWSVSL